MRLRVGMKIRLKPREVLIKYNAQKSLIALAGKIVTIKQPWACDDGAHIFEDSNGLFRKEFEIVDEDIEDILCNLP